MFWKGNLARKRKKKQCKKGPISHPKSEKEIKEGTGGLKLMGNYVSSL